MQKGDKQMREAQFVKSLTVALSEDVYQKIKELTDQEKISMAQWVRRAVNKALEGDAVEEE
jgi:predicted HicB family RNase H-like nuclease